MSGNHNKYQGESMSALQIWLQNQKYRLTQDAIDEALMEYIGKIERELAQHKAIIAEQKAVIDMLHGLVDTRNDQIKELKGEKTKTNTH
jgi:hypothetical protein